MDPMVRYPDDPAPLIPGSLVRFRWPKDSHDTEVIRSRVQEGGRGLYVLEAPGHAGGSPVKVLAEAYYPDEMREYAAHLDAPRLADYRMGRLVVINTPRLRGTTQLGSGQGSFRGYTRLTEDMIHELRKHNRAARRELKRTSAALYRKQELDNAHREHDEKVFDEWSEEYAHAYIEGWKYAVSPIDGGVGWRHNIIHRR